MLTKQAVCTYTTMELQEYLDLVFTELSNETGAINKQAKQVKLQLKCTEMHMHAFSLLVPWI